MTSSGPNSSTSATRLCPSAMNAGIIWVSRNAPSVSAAPKIEPRRNEPAFSTSAAPSKMITWAPLLPAFHSASLRRSVFIRSFRGVGLRSCGPRGTNFRAIQCGWVPLLPGSTAGPRRTDAPRRPRDPFRLRSVAGKVRRKGENVTSPGQPERGKSFAKARASCTSSDRGPD